MTPLELLRELQALGVQLTADGDRLVYDAPKGIVTSELLARLILHKYPLLTLLKTAPLSDPSDNTDTDKTPDEDHENGGFVPGYPEFKRFHEVCSPLPDGRGWYDPSELRALQAIAQAGAYKPTGTKQREPVRDVNGLTFVERAERYRDGWAVTGYPPGVTLTEVHHE